MSTRFVADVGGTNIRLCIIENGELSAIKKYVCTDFETIGSAVQHYFDEFPELTFTDGCIAIACPVPGDWVKMTNHTWQFSIKELKQQLNFHSYGKLETHIISSHW